MRAVADELSRWDKPALPRLLGHRPGVPVPEGGRALHRADPHRRPSRSGSRAPPTSSRRTAASRSPRSCWASCGTPDGAAARADAAADGRELAQALALRRRLRRALHALRRRDRDRAGARDLLGALGPRGAGAPRAHPPCGPVLAGPQVSFGERSVAVRSRDVEIDLELGDGQAIECECPAGDGGVHLDPEARGRRRPRASSAIGSHEHALRGRGVDDRSAGYHARRTSWLWSAGVGEAADGRPVAWNLVSGINDPPTVERARDLGRRRPDRAGAGHLRRARLDRLRGRLGARLRGRGGSRAHSEGVPHALRLRLRGAVRLVHRVPAAGSSWRAGRE